MSSSATPAVPPAPNQAEMYPLFLRLRGKRVLVVGAGPVATSKLVALRAAGADLVVVAPEISADIRAQAERGELVVHAREVREADVDEAWLVVAAAPSPVNRAVRTWAEARRCFVLAVDDVEATDAFSPAVFARAGVRVALSSEGRAPALIGLLREALEHALPDDAELERWLQVATEARAGWKRDALPLPERRSRLLSALCEARGTCERREPRAVVP